MLKNKKGIIQVIFPAGMLVVMAGTVIFAHTLGRVKGGEPGLAKKNGQRIWCKMQNKDAADCDAKYK